MTDVVISKKNEIDLLLECEQAILYELQEEFSFDVEGASFSPAYRKKYWDGKVRLISVTKNTAPAGMVWTRQISTALSWLDAFTAGENNAIVRNFELSDYLHLGGSYVHSASSNSFWGLN